MDPHLDSEVRTYQELKGRLITMFGETDEETLADTLEGVSDLPDLLQRLVRSALRDEASASALRVMAADMKARLGRLETRARNKRAAAADAMVESGIKRLDAPDFTAGLRAGSLRADIIDEGSIPDEYWRPQPPKLDKAGLISALKAGRDIAGAVLGEGAATISVRTT